MSKKRIAAFFIALALLLTAGCGGESIRGSISAADRPRSTPAPEESPSEEEIEVRSYGGEHFAEVRRPEVHFEDMEYVRYEEADFMALCDEVYGFAENGGSRNDADDALWLIYDELCYIYTLYTLAELRCDSDPTDSAAAEELEYISDIYFRMYDEYMFALGALAASKNSKLMSLSYDMDTINYFADYYGERPEDYDGGAELEAFSRENALVSDYFRIMAEELPDEKAAAEIFVELVEHRREEAALYGYESYADYAYSEFYYKDYYPSDAEVLWAGVKEYFVPIVAENYDSVSRGVERMSITGDVDCSTEAVLGALERNLPKISGELFDAYEYMIRNGLCDIGYDPRKADMGYTTRLYYYSAPYIFNGAYDEFYDYLDMIHEFGHFANGLYTESDLIFGASDNDLSELQSQGLEMIFTAFYDDIFGKYAGKVEDFVLMDMLMGVVDGAMYDEFQQRVYAEEELSAERVCEIFAGLYEDYGYEPYEGYEYEWIYVVHNFEYPFYYISYAVSALGALEIYSLMQSDFDAAVDKYLEVCAMDTEIYYYSEALEEAGFMDIFSEESYAAIAENINAHFE